MSRRSESSSSENASDDRLSLGPADRVIPSWTESIAKQLTKTLGGPLGVHAMVGRGRFLTPLRVVLLVAVLTLGLGWLDKAPCAQHYTDSAGQQQLDWRNYRQYVSFCYSDTIPLYGDDHLDQPDDFPYKTSWTSNPGTASAQVSYMEYPVLTGLFQWANAQLAQEWEHLAAGFGLPHSTPTVIVYFDICVFLLALAWMVSTWALTRIARRRPWDVVIAAASPLVIVHAFTNFDALAVAFTSTGLLAWSRRRPALAGVLLGLGAAAKLYPVLLLIPLLALCIRAGRVGPWLTAAIAAGVAWLVVNLPIALLYPSGWWEFFKLNTLRNADPDSIYNVVSYFTGWPGFDPNLAANSPPTVLNTVTLVLFLAAIAAIGWIALSAPRRPRLAQLGFLVVVAFLLTNKVWSPQYSLWLVPLGVLAMPRWKPLLAWMTLDALVWFPRMAYYLQSALLSANPPLPDRGLPEGWFLGMVIVRDLAVLGICALIVRDVYRPERDPVRLAGDDDPTGGVLDGAPDVFRIPAIKSMSKNMVEMIKKIPIAKPVMRR